MGSAGAIAGSQAIGLAMPYGPAGIVREMGVLDEAIKDHLELKRRRGADPHQVALLEHEAFGGEDEGADRPGMAQEAQTSRQHEPWAADATVSPASAGQSSRNARNVNQETMEIDMRALLGTQDEISAKRLDEPAIEARDARPTDEELDEYAWEAPQRPRRFQDRHLESQECSTGAGQPASWL